MAHITVRDLSVDLPIFGGGGRSLKRAAFAAARGRVQQEARQLFTVEALRGISLDLRRGDRLGLIGANGAGKTTLLRTLAGIYEPVRGQVRVDGAIGALLDPGLGMNGDLTGRENIGLRGLYHGLQAAALARLEADVEEFAGLGAFLDLPLRSYSSGMTIRLGFALATAIRPDVLLMDEWFLAGDAAFMDKAAARLEAVVRGSEILVLSSHAMPVIRDWCTRVIHLQEGRIVDDGKPEEVIARYLAGETARAA